MRTIYYNTSNIKDFWGTDTQEDQMSPIGEREREDNHGERKFL